MLTLTLFPEQLGWNKREDRWNLEAIAGSVCTACFMEGEENKTTHSSQTMIYEVKNILIVNVASPSWWILLFPKLKK
jgi:hypothetical protein